MPRLVGNRNSKAYESVIKHFHKENGFKVLHSLMMNLNNQQELEL